MAVIAKSLGRNRDLPQLEAVSFAGGTAAFEHTVVALTNLATGATSGTVGALPENAMTIRALTLVFEAAITGAATNNVTLNLNQYRAGAILVNTTISAVSATGLQTVTPAALTNIAVGMSLNIAAGGGTAETIVVSSVNVGAGTFSAVFAYTHSASTACTSTPLASITFASGTNAAKLTPIQLSTVQNTILGGDVVTIALVVNGSGLTYTAGVAYIDWIPVRPG
jgi:hypothetical protein